MHTEHVLEQIFALPVLLGQVMSNPESKKLLVPLEEFLGMTVEFLGSKDPSVENQNEENAMLWSSSSSN